MVKSSKMNSIRNEIDNLELDIDEIKDRAKTLEDLGEYNATSKRLDEKRIKEIRKRITNLKSTL